MNGHIHSIKRVGWRKWNASLTVHRGPHEEEATWSLHGRSLKELRELAAMFGADWIVV